MTKQLQESSLWHPYTQMKTADAPLKVRSGRGSILELEDGRQLIDCISSWWVNLHGHGHPKISAAIYQQALKLEHVLFAGFSHEPAETLAKMLLEVLPDQFSKVFYSDNGSTAAEIALKQAYQYWRNQGEQNRTSFICFESGYHGDTIGAMSLSSHSVFTDPFTQLLFEITRVPYPIIDETLVDIETREQQSLDHIERLLKQQPQRYAAVIIEPLVQGTGGMRMCRSKFLRDLQELVKKYKSLLIYDEVMTGFGRTGDWFACTVSNTCPDIICLAKGLSGGFLPIAATVCTEEVYQAFHCDEFPKAFFHGHTYTANPLGCASAIASLELLKENPDMFLNMESRHRPHLERLKELKCLQNIRCCGSIVAMNVVSSVSHEYGGQLSLILRRKAIEEGLLLRPIGNTLYMMPPYCITDDQLAAIYSGIHRMLSDL